jgi:signal transduction histidine kinase
LAETENCNVTINHPATNSRSRWPSVLPLMVICVLIAGKFSVPAEPAAGVLTNAADVIALSAADAARSLKVSVSGVVTASDPALKGRFFLQDTTSGVFVDNVNGPHLEPGTAVEISGITYAGAYAPTITAPKVQVIGTAKLPLAKPVSVEELMSGAEDSQRIETAGIVRDARVDGTRLLIDLAEGGYRFRAYATVPADYASDKLIGSRVRIRGTAAEAHNRSLRQLILVEIYIPTLSDLVIERTESRDPFEKPVIPLNNLAQYRRDNSLDQRVHVRGVVTLQNTGESLFLQDDVGGLQIQSRETAVCNLGETVEAVGFLNFENYLPVLQDAIFRKVSGPVTPIQPKRVTIAELQNGLHHAECISLTGKLIERTIRHGGGSKYSPANKTTVLVLQGSNFTFTAEAGYLPDQPELEAIQFGSLVRVTGVCLTQIDSDGKLRAFQVLVRGPEDVQVIQEPSWWTPRRLLIGVAIICAVLVVIMSWSVMLSRKNSVLNYLVREREKAQLALQQVNDQLEERVKERTNQLRVQITARKESELQFKAILAERTRLAQELHDTVEQTLAGIAMELDTSVKLYEKNPQDALAHLELSCDLMSRSQLEVRQSIWNLRRLVQEHFDIASAMLENARQLLAGTNLQVDLQVQGEVRPLPEVIEENFLRIGREAIVNVIKHAQATTVNIRLAFEPRRVVLEIKDNGRGFVPGQAAGPDEGHFGVLGMAERIKRLGGKFDLISAPGKGTSVKVEINLEPAMEPATQTVADLNNFDEELRENPDPDR